MVWTSCPQHSPNYRRSYRMAELVEFRSNEGKLLGVVSTANTSMPPGRDWLTTFRECVSRPDSSLTS